MPVTCKGLINKALKDKKKEDEEDILPKKEEKRRKSWKRRKKEELDTLLYTVSDNRNKNKPFLFSNKSFKGIYKTWKQ